LGEVVLEVGVWGRDMELRTRSASIDSKDGSPARTEQQLVTQTADQNQGNGKPKTLGRE